LSAAASQGATIAFPHDSATLSLEARRAIRGVADAYKARGGGHVRVVGHSSMRTADMPVDQHVLINFRVSLERAKAVADELLRLGVPPSALIVDAVGDAQPRFLEAMPAGEAGNRRVELYVEA
jgi:outer membrane protein OmpA-like peptidoglycan-associated protein